MLIARWRIVDCCPPVRMAFEGHLHGREMRVDAIEGEHDWRWQVATPHGHLLASGVAPERHAAQQAAEDEVLAVHPPTTTLVEDLLA